MRQITIMILISMSILVSCKQSNDTVTTNKEEMEKPGLTDNPKVIEIDNEKGVVVVNAPFLIGEKMLNIPDNDKKELSHYHGKFEVDCKRKIVCELYGENLRDKCTDFESYKIIYKYTCQYLELKKLP